LQKFTTDAFPQNPYASRIHVPLERLPAFQQAHRGATFAAYFSSSYEIASSFVVEALTTLKETNSSSLVVPPRLKRLYQNVRRYASTVHRRHAAL
jgi:hypothetical protein